MDTDQESNTSDLSFADESDFYDENESDLELDEENVIEDDNEEQIFIHSIISTYACCWT
jgi:hypothetical protein